MAKRKVGDKCPRCEVGRLTLHCGAQYKACDCMRCIACNWIGTRDGKRGSTLSK